MKPREGEPHSEAEAEHWEKEINDEGSSSALVLSAQTPHLSAIMESRDVHPWPLPFCSLLQTHLQEPILAQSCTVSPWALEDAHSPRTRMPLPIVQ